MTRRGFALAAVLFALVLLAALTAAGFFSALQEVRAGRNASGQLRAQSAATSAIGATMAGWDPLTMDALPIGTVVSPAVPAGPGVTVQVTARRLSSRFFLLKADAGFGQAMRSVGAMVRLRGLELQPLVAVRTRSIDASAAANIDAVDRPPAGWTCPPVSDTITTVSIQSGASDAVFFQFGDRDWFSLVAWAGAVPPGGDSLRVRLDPGDLSLSGSRVLGVLIVNGDLTLSAGAEVVGIVIVRGSLVLQGAGGTVVGTLVASQVVAQPGYAPTRPLVAWSSCALQAAALARAWAEPVPGQPPVTFFQ